MEFFGEEMIHGEFPRSEDEDDQGSEEEEKGSGGDELVRVCEDGFHRFQICSEIGHDHGNDQWDGGEAGSEADEQQEAPHALGGACHGRIECREWDAEFLEKAGGGGQVSQLAHAGLEKLPAPIETDGKEERRFQRFCCGDEFSVADACAAGELVFVHL